MGSSNIARIVRLALATDCITAVASTMASTPADAQQKCVKGAVWNYALGRCVCTDGKWFINGQCR